MTTPNLTAVPKSAKSRKSRSLIALVVVGSLALGGGVAGVTFATQAAKDSTAVTWEQQLIGITATENAAFNLTPGAVPTTQYLDIANTGGTGIKGHASFAPTYFTPTVPAALDDAIVRVWDTAVSGPTDPSEVGTVGYWEGTLREFLNTGFVSNTAIAGGQSAGFGISVATPYDVDTNDWLVGEISESINQSTFVSLIVQADLSEQSALTAGSTFHSTAGLRTAAAALVLDAAAAISSGSQVVFPSFTEDSDTVPGSIIRTFYTDPSQTTVLGSILLDATKNEGDDGYIVNSDYDGDDTHLDLYGIVQAG